eukprot:12760424-Alexandrium_andersonii.AAC.1
MLPLGCSMIHHMPIASKRTMMSINLFKGGTSTVVVERVPAQRQQHPLRGVADYAGAPKHA